MKHAAPVGLTEIKRDMRVRVKNHTLLRLGKVRPQLADGRRTGWREEHESVYAEPEAARLGRPRHSSRPWTSRASTSRSMFPCRGLFVLGLDSVRADRRRRPRAGLRHRHRRGLQRLAGRLLQGGPERMFGAAMVAPHDIDGAVLEARRCVEELGFKAVFLAPGCVNRRPWHHPAYDPLWAELAAPRRAAHVPRRRADLPHARLLADRARQADDVARLQPAARHPVRPR